ncbi:hypothetical protein D3C77_704690 [compost metagenome]
MAEHEGVVGGLDQQRRDCDVGQEIAARRAPVVVLGVPVAMQRGGDAPVEVPEGAHAVERAQAAESGKVLLQVAFAEQPLLVLHVGDHRLHEMRLINT